MPEQDEQYSLKREIGWYGSFCMGYADVGADIFVALGLVALYAAGASPIAFLIASITYICTGLAYAELASTYPYAGGAHVYAMKAFNDLAGFVAGWAVMLDYTVDIALFSLASAGYLSFFFPSVRTAHIEVQLGPASIHLPLLGIIAVFLILLLLLPNVLGIRESSLFNEILVAFGIALQGLVLVAGLLLAFSLSLFLYQVGIFGALDRLANVQYIVPTFSVQTQNFIYGVTLAMTSFIGIESVAQAAEETKRPDKVIPRANKASIASVLILAVGFSMLSMGILPWGDLAASSADPITSIAVRIPAIGQILAPIVAVAGVTICYVSANTGVIGVSRIVFSMGRFRLLPRWFYKVHPKYRTPIRTILVFTLIGAAMAAVGELTFVADLYNYGALLSYVVVNICLVVLRNKEPEAYRAWKVPGDLKLNIRGRPVVLPVIGLIGVGSCLVIWLLILGFHEAGRILGTAWIAIGVVGFIAFRRRMHLPVLSDQGGREIAPGGYVMNAVVLVRTPEDEKVIVSSIKNSFDTRFRITLMTILDPEELGLPLSRVSNYHQLKSYEAESKVELESIAGGLRRLGFDVGVRVEIGKTEEIVREVAASELNDTVALIKRRSQRGHLVKYSEDSVLSIASEYPGKLMVVRRSE